MNLQIWLESDNIFSRSIEHCLRNRFADCGESWQAKCAASFSSAAISWLKQVMRLEFAQEKQIHDVMV